MTSIIHCPWDSETPHSLVNRIHDHLETDPALPKLFDIRTKVAVCPSLNSKYPFCPAWFLLTFFSVYEPLERNRIK